jgi:hypothetical protein
MWYVQKARVVNRKTLYPLVWTAVFVASALGAFLFVRTLMVPAPADPTRDRIQALIDEADQLRKTLDESRRG